MFEYLTTEMEFVHLKRTIRVFAEFRDTTVSNFEAFDCTDAPSQDDEGVRITDEEDLGALHSIFRHKMGKVRF